MKLLATLLLPAALFLTACAYPTIQYASPSHEEASRCVRVYAEIALHHHYSLWEGRWPRAPHTVEEDRTTYDRRAGTAFAVMVNDRPFIVTAAHILSITWRDGDASLKASISKGTVWLTRLTTRIRVSSLAYTPLRIYLDEPSDLAIMEMPADFWQNVTPVRFNLDRRLPPVEQPVKVWGFPSTSTPQIADGRRLDVASDEMLVINGMLEPGFSGGPLLTADNDRLLGMVTRSTDRQARAVPAARILQAIHDFETKSVPYSDPLDIDK